MQKRRKKVQPVVPLLLADLTIDGQFASTIDGKPFLLYDNKSTLSRIIIFSDTESLKVLSQASTWMMDGTFKCAPRNLLQLYSIHALIDKISIPCVYILTQNRDQKTYEEAFGQLKTSAIEKNIILNPKIVMADFEKASTNAISFYFPSIQIKECWFHFRQTIFRRAIRIGLKKKK